MKVVFHLDNKEVVEVDPTELQLRQLGPDQSALGVKVQVTDPNDSSKQIEAFRPFINYAVNLTAAAADQKAIAKAEAKRARKAGKR